MAELVLQRMNEPPASRSRRVLVLVLPDVHALDFGGPVQAVHEATIFGAEYAMTFVGAHERARSAQGFTIADLEPLPEPKESDWIIVPGTESTRLDVLDVPVDWLRAAEACGARVSSVCSGSFALAQAGLLDGRSCTTHWKVVERLRTTYPDATVLENRLFVRDGNLVTSAGVASGIDMALALIEEDQGPKLAAQVTREMVVYLRRCGDSSQSSIYQEHRSHLHQSIHRVQDWLIEHPDRLATIDELAELAHLSPRHLTRLFRQETGVTLKTFATQVRLEVARQLLTRPELQTEDIALRCGFQDARQLRRLWKKHVGTTLGETRRGQAPRARSSDPSRRQDNACETLP
ncbi:MAG: helix-turn-helix domain-containing protein [Acidobacteriota bacterium]